MTLFRRRATNAAADTFVRITRREAGGIQHAHALESKPRRTSKHVAFRADDDANDIAPIHRSLN